MGPLTLSGDDEALTGLGFGESVGRGLAPGRRALRAGAPAAGRVLRRRADRVRALRCGSRGRRSSAEVWEALRDIPYGTTTTYGELAEAIGSVGGARKVGSANARNPIAIVVPCHRVIGADGKLVGYGGGLDSKRDLLALEGALLAV